MTLQDVTIQLKEVNTNIQDLKMETLDTNEYLLLTVDTLKESFQNLLNFFQGEKLKEIEEKRERDAFNNKLLAALETKSKNEPIKKEEKKEGGFGLPGILAGLAITIGTIAGAIKAQVEAIKLFTTSFGKAVRAFGKAISPKFITEGISKAVKGFTNSIAKQFNNLKSTLSNSKIFKGISDTVKAFFKPFRDVYIIMKRIVRTSGKAASLVSDIGSTLSKFTSLLSSTLKFASRLFLPLTIAITLWDTVKGMFEGFEKEGIVGGIKGAITGLFNSLIFGPLDLIKSAVSWVLGFFGFEKAEAILDSFSFEDTFTAIIDALFYPFKLVQDAVVGAKKYIADKFGSVLSFFGINFGGEEEKLKKEVAKEKDFENEVKQAGAVAIDPDTGGVIAQTDYINGVFDPEESRRALEARGLRPLNEEERANLEANLEAGRKEKEAALKEIQDSPKFADFLPSIDDITTKLKGIGTSIWDSITAAFDSITESIKEVDIMESISGVSDMASNFFKNILKGVLPAPDAMTVELPSVDTWFGKVGGGTINLNPIPDSMYEFAGINPSTGEDISPPSSKKSEALSEEMQMATSEQNQIKDAGSVTTNVVDASNVNSNITNNTSNTTIVAPAPNPVRQPNSPSDTIWAGASVAP